MAKKSLIIFLFFYFFTNLNYDLNLFFFYLINLQMTNKLFKTSFNFFFVFCFPFWHLIWISPLGLKCNQ